MSEEQKGKVFARAEECLEKMFAAAKACGFTTDEMRASLFYGSSVLLKQVVGGKSICIQLEALARGTLQKKGKR